MCIRDRATSWGTRWGHPVAAWLCPSGRPAWVVSHVQAHLLARAAVTDGLAVPGSRRGDPGLTGAGVQANDLTHHDNGRRGHRGGRGADRVEIADHDALGRRTACLLY